MPLCIESKSINLSFSLYSLCNYQNGNNFRNAFGSKMTEINCLASCSDRVDMKGVNPTAAPVTTLRKALTFEERGS